MKTTGSRKAKANIDRGPKLWLAAILLAVSIGAVYGRYLDVPFIFDDKATIKINPSIKSMWPLVNTVGRRGPLNPPPQIPTSGRPLVNLSFALNYYFSGLAPVSFHAVNIFIHFLSALVLWALVRRTLLLPYFAERYSNTAGWLALAVALLWSLHPLQTETVIYATQRTELMFAFFYLATLYCSLRYWSSLPLPLGEGRGEDSSSALCAGLPTPHASGPQVSSEVRHPNLWLLLAILSSAAGMASKEVMVSAPLIVLLFDRTLISGSFQTALRRSWPLYVGLAATWVILLALNIGAPRSRSAGFHLDVPAWSWWLTQTKVLLLYFKLVVWPWPLLFHYDFGYLTTLAQAWMYVLPALLLGAATLVLLWRNKPLGFVGACVFAILLPTFIVPIITEMAAERRMYVPLAAIVPYAVIAFWVLASAAYRSFSQNASDGDDLPRAFIVVPAVFLAIVFAFVDVHRLGDYRDEMVLWRQVLLHQPNNHLAHSSVAYLLSYAGHPEEAIEEYRASLSIKPDDPFTLDNFGIALSRLGRSSEAIEKLTHAVQLMPDFAEAHSNLGKSLSDTGRHPEAIMEIHRALTLAPNDPFALFNMGLVLSRMERFAEAVEYFDGALIVQPTFVDARVSLAAALVRTGRIPEAIEHLTLALKMKPTDVEAHNTLGLVFAGSGKMDDAIVHFQRALQLRPDRDDVHNNLGDLYQQIKQPQKAIEQYQIILQLKPDSLQTYFKLFNALAAAGQSKEAYSAAEKAIALARSTGKTAAAEQIEERLKKYQAELQHRDALPATP